MEQGAPQGMPFGFVPGGGAGAPAPMAGMPGGMPGMPGPMTGMPGAMAGYPGAMPGGPGAMAGYPAAGYPGAMPGMAQPYQAPQPQAAPVAPVGFPAVPQAQGPAQTMTPQQAMTRQMISVARTLEQGLPAYQILASVVGDLVRSALPGADELYDALRDAVYFHYTALGAIRRTLSGEFSPDLMTALSAAVHSLMRLHNAWRPMIERLQASAPAELRTPINGLAHMASTMEPILSQVSNAVQAIVGPQAWEMARAQVNAAAQS